MRTRLSIVWLFIVHFTVTAEILQLAISAKHDEVSLKQYDTNTLSYLITFFISFSDPKFFIFLLYKNMCNKIR